jgi:hypothetical protein
VIFALGRFTPKLVASLEHSGDVARSSLRGMSRNGVLRAARRPD